MVCPREKQRVGVDARGKISKKAETRLEVERARPIVMARAEGRADFSAPGFELGTDWERGELRAQTVVDLWDLGA